MYLFMVVLLGWLGKMLSAYLVYIQRGHFYFFFFQWSISAICVGIRPLRLQNLNFLSQNLNFFKQIVSIKPMTIIEDISKVVSFDT
jgi:hypothetical protein